MSKASRILIIVTIALFGAIATWNGYNLLRPQATTRTSGTALVGGPFNLVRQDGIRITEKDLQGHYSLIFFGYTYCPDVCPAGLQVMSAALEKLGGRADNIQPVFITIDPERDTAEVLASYVENFHPRLIGLTGSAEDVARAAKAYRVYYAKAKGEEAGEDYLMDHSSIIYLMGPKGEFVKHFTYTSDADALAKAIGTAIEG